MTGSFPFEFTCRRSGNCCSRPHGFVRVSADEVSRIAVVLGMTPAAVRSRYVDGDRLKSGLGHRCVFLDDGAETSCRIYSARPERCRTWPFWPELRDDPEALGSAARLCPGIKTRACASRPGAGRSSSV